LEEILQSDSNLKNFKQQILDSGLTITEILSVSGDELQAFFQDYLKMTRFSAKKATEALYRRIGMVSITK
jgi:hypothetical protein